MGREVIERDVVRIRKILREVLGHDDFEFLERMGGLTNHTYKVVLCSKEELVVRIPGEGTEEMISRTNEKVSTELACGLNIDAELLYFGKDGTKITRYLPDAVTMSKSTMKEKEIIGMVADIFRKLHSCQKETQVPFEVFDMAQGYEQIIQSMNVEMYEDYDEIKHHVMEVKCEIDNLIHPVKVPCHNDPLCENWVLSQGNMYLIDWEYAGMNDAMWDLADVSIEAEYDSKQDDELLKAYLKKDPSILDRKHFLANKIYVDFLWTLWAKARVPYDGQPMEEWADERYSRLKKLISLYRKMNQ